MNAVLNFKTDAALKKEAQQVAKDLGLPLGTIMNNYLRDLVLNRRVVFEDTYEPAEEVVQELLRASEDFAKGINISPGFDNAADAIDWLNSDDPQYAS